MSPSIDGHSQSSLPISVSSVITVCLKPFIRTILSLTYILLTFFAYEHAADSLQRHDSMKIRGLSILQREDPAKAYR